MPEQPTDEYSIVDVSEWPPTDDEPLGTKTKVWLRDAADRRWLFKEVRGQDRDLSPEGEDWAEKVAAEFAARIGLPAARVELASRAGRRGIISLSGLERKFGDVSV